MKIEYEDLDQYLEGKDFIVGSDEVGYGSNVANLVVCGVKAPKGWSLQGLNDSKKLSPKRREIMREKLLALADDNIIQYHIAERTNTQIDEFGLGVMLKDCYVEIFKELYSNDSLIICDGNMSFDGLGIDYMAQVSIVKADGLCPSVMAASIIAKTHRDAQMREMHKLFPQYGWDANKGYLAKNHLEGIRKYGFTPLHRMSYKIKL